MADYTVDDIVTALREAGVCEGDNIFIHCNIGFFGRLEGATSSDTLCEGFLEGLKRAVGPEGTLVVPTFSYSFCHGEVYNPATTKSGCGLFTEYIYKQDGVIRSLDPNFSVAAIGKYADYFTEKPTNESFCYGSFWTRLMEKKGKIVCMNMDCGSTFVHYIEKQNEVPYRYNKAFNGCIELPDGTVKRDYFVHFVYGLESPEDGPYFTRLDEKIRCAGLCRTANLGKGTLLAMDANEYYDFISKTLKSEPRFLTRGGDI